MNTTSQKGSSPAISFLAVAKTLLLTLLTIFFTQTIIAQPNGFVDQTYLSGFSQAVGLTFDENGRMYVWEKGGKVWIVENGVRRSQPLIDISEEVGNWRDFGLLGFALDPNFLSNGRFYLLYLVDRHHLFNFGTSNYDPNADEYFDATIGRITRYTATASSNFTQTNYNSRRVLLGTTRSNGFPNLHQSHGTGSLVFGTDGTLLASFGDGASYSSRDEGSASETYYAQAIADGIIPANHNIGAYRAQLLNSLAGKMVRINPENGNGYPSNPFYQSNNPGSIRSRIWALGLRNPCRFTKRPETGSHVPEDGNPGVFYIGDVGWGSREELSVMTTGGQNFGWPKYEGMTREPGYNNNSYAPASHTLPKIDWRTGASRAYRNGNIVNIGSTSVPGPSFTGNCSIGGTWYSSDDFPSQWQNSYFHADYGGDWIKQFVFDENNEPTRVRNFKSGADRIVFIAEDPINGSLYYIGGAQGNSANSSNVIRRISYTGQAPPPVADAEISEMFGSSPLTVTFDGTISYDPSGTDLTYNWNFGDGGTSTSPTPTHIFTASGNQSFTVTLTVTNAANQTDTKEFEISLNNTPPVINSTSINNTNTFSVNNSTTLNLSANVSDAQTGVNQLAHRWQVALYHNDHFHAEAPINSRTGTALLSPVGCDGATYWYRVTLTVTDPQGLMTTYTKDIFPNCSGSNQTINFSPLADRLVANSPFNLNASASSGLPVIFFVRSGPATMSGNQVTLTGEPGVVTIVATQPGNGSFKPAPPVERMFRVRTSLPPVIGNGTGITGTYFNNANFTNQALERIDPTIDFDWGTGSPASNIGANTFSVRWEGEISAGYSETYTFYARVDDGVRLWVDNQQIINQWIDQAPTVHTGTIALQAGEKVPFRMEYYENSGGAVAELEWSSASQSRGIVPTWALYPNATPQPQDQTISFTNILNKQTTDAPFNISATASSGLPVSFTIVSGPASISGNRITLNGNTGTVTVRASQGGNSEYNPAPNVTRSFTVSAPAQQNQTINFSAISDKETDDAPFTISATASSGLAVSFSIVSGPATISGNQITLNGTAGTVTVRASQAGNSQYNPAPNVNRSFTVTTAGGGGGGGDCNNPSNIALDKPTTQSSQYNGSPAPSEKIVDGNTNGVWYAPNGYSIGSTNWGQNEFIEIDLEEVSEIKEIKVYNRTDCCQTHLASFYVLVSDVPFNSNNLNTVLNQSGVEDYYTEGNAGRPTTIDINRTGRYVRIQRNGFGFIQIAEVEVMGCNGSGGGGDTTRPSVNLTTANINVTGAFTVNATFSENVTGFALNDVNVTNGSKSNLSGSGSNYSFRITPTNEGNVAININANRVQDAAGNQNTASSTLNVTYSTGGGGGDTTRPTVQLSTNSTNVTGAFTVNATFSENVSGFALNDVAVTNGNTTNLSGSGSNYSFRVTPTAAGSVTVRVNANRTQDAAGNQNTASNTLNVNYSTGGGGGGGGTLPTGYCGSRGSAPWVEWISEVSFANMSNTSGKDLYGNYLTQIANVSKGGSYNLTVKPNYSWTQFDEYIRVWIDWNRDGDFDDSGERVLSGINAGGAPQATVNGVSANVTVPNGASTGPTRMRVAMQRGAHVDPCENPGQGEVEDYRVEIAAATATPLQAHPGGISDFTADGQQYDIHLQWSADILVCENCISIKKQQLQHSTDNENFTDIFTPTEAIINGENHFQFTHARPIKGENFYRLKTTFSNGKIQFSEVQTINFGIDLNDVTLFPNPTTDEVFIQLGKYVNQKVRLQVVDNQGVVVKNILIGKAPDYPMLLDLTRFVAGVYHVVVEVGEERTVRQLVVK